MNMRPGLMRPEPPFLNPSEPDEGKLLAELDRMHKASALDARRALNHLVHEFEISVDEANRVLRVWLRRLVDTSERAYGEPSG